MSTLFMKGWVILAGLCLQLHSIECKQLLVFLLDGFRWDYFDIHGEGLRGFPEMFKTGLRAEHTVMDFPTKSNPNHYTIFTGLYNEIHGIVANWIYDPVRKEYFILDEGYDQPFWWDEGDPLWITATRQQHPFHYPTFPLFTKIHNDMKRMRSHQPFLRQLLHHNKVPFQCVAPLEHSDRWTHISQQKSVYMYYWPQCEVEIRGLKPKFCLQRRGIPTMEDFRYAISESVEVLHNSSADLVGIYFQLSDSIAHRFGPRSRQVRQVIENVDEQLYQLLRELERRGISGEVDIVITSDHGMTDVSPDRVLGIEQFLNVDDVDIFLGGGPFLSIWPKPGKLDQVYKALKNASKHFSVYKKEETPLEWHYRKHYRIAPILVSPELGWLVFKPNQVIAGGSANPQIGNHGYDNRLPDMWGIFVATGPSFKSSYVSKPIKSVDMYQVMCKSLDIQPSPHNGTWNNVKDMFLSSAEPTSQISSTTRILAGSTATPTTPTTPTTPKVSTATIPTGSQGQIVLMITIYMYHFCC